MFINNLLIIFLFFTQHYFERYVFTIGDLLLRCGHIYDHCRLDFHGEYLPSKSLFLMYQIHCVWSI